MTAKKCKKNQKKKQTNKFTKQNIRIISTGLAAIPS